MVFKINITPKHLLLMALVVILISSVIVVVLFPRDSFLDSDGDGVTNDKDAFPHNKMEQNDSDSDGVGDNEDKFPFDPAASKDSDDDGYPDEWNEGRSQQDSTSSPRLIIDEFPFDPNEHKDSDGDNVGDNGDVFPNNPDEWSDDDLDGIGNNADRNPLVDLSFTLTIDSCKVTKQVDLLPWAQVYFDINYAGNSVRVDNNGSYWRVIKNQETSIGYVLQYDIPDDTSSDITIIDISMFDHDRFLKDDQIDISSQIGKTAVSITVDHATNTVDIDSSSSGEGGNIWFSVLLPVELTPSSQFINRTYRWRYIGETYKISLQIPTDKYQWYANRDVNRSPQRIGKSAMRSFVTSNDVVITTLADELDQLADSSGFGDRELINFVLTFTQSVVNYQSDNDTKGCVEYWKYPVETLVEQTGDCEDSSLLFVSIMDYLDYDSVLLFYVLEDNNGHLASGIGSDEPIGETVIRYKNTEYYYCETTSRGFAVGDKPAEIPDEPEVVIPIP